MQSLIDLLREYGVYGLTAFVVTVLTTPIAVRVAMRTGVMDMPDQVLKPHARPTPYLGGVAIMLGWAVALIAAKVQGTIIGTFLMPIMAGGIAMTVIGAIDDIRHIHGRIRLALTAAVTIAVLFTSGLGLELVKISLWRLDIEIPGYVAMPISVMISLFIVLGACNSANLIDGLDGLLSGVTAIMSFGFLLLAAFLALHQHSPKLGDPGRLTLAMALLGAVIGFLPWNFHPARIFMGDAGSILLGFNCGMMILLFAERGYVRWVIGAIMIFGLPIFDTALTLVRRFRKRQSIFDGDRSHIYDQLVQRGMTVRQAVMTCYALTAFFVSSGLLVIYLRTRFAAIVLVCVCLVTAFAAWRYKLTHPAEFEIERQERERRERRFAQTPAPRTGGQSSADSAVQK